MTPRCGYTANGQAVATLNLATTENWKDKEGQRQEKTEWHRVVSGARAADARAIPQKGKQICHRRAIETRQWDDKDGNKRYTTEIKADRVTLLGGGGGGGGQSGGPEREYGGQSTPMSEPADMPEDDIPF